jgi:hypothetical protein
VDPRTIDRVMRGDDVRGMAGHRARRLLIEEGLLTDRGAGKGTP